MLSVFAHSKDAYVVVFDNGSDPPIENDGSDDDRWLGILWGIGAFEAIRRSPEVNATEGLTGTWNAGLWWCESRGCDRVVLLNHDTVVDESWPRYLECLTERDGPVGPTTNKTGTIYQVTPEQKEGFGEFSEVNGFCFGASMNVFRKNMFDDRHYFDPAFPFGGNENEWCRRWRKKGGKSYVAYDTFVFHHKAAEWRKIKS